MFTFQTLSVRHQNITVKFVKQSKTKSMKLSKRWKVKVRTGTENNNYTKIAQILGRKGGEKTILASKYRAAKAGHISAKGNGG